MSELPCYTKKAPRAENEREEIYSVCKCGHYSHDHDRLEKTLIPKVFLWLITLGKYGGGCDDCSCNMFNRLGRFTYEEKNSLKQCEDSR